MKLKNGVFYLVEWKPDRAGLLGLSIVYPHDGSLFNHFGKWYGEERNVLRAVELNEVIEVLDKLDKWIYLEGEEDE